MADIRVASLCTLSPERARPRRRGRAGLTQFSKRFQWFAGTDDNATRKKLKLLKWALSVFFIVLGLATFAAYMKIGYDNRYAPGARYTPAWLQNPPQSAPPGWWPSWLNKGH